MKTTTSTLLGRVLVLSLSLSPSYAAEAAASATKTLSFPNSQPTNAVVAPPGFVSVGFETAFADEYANAFSENLVTSLADRMSVPPVIRIGGTSGDRVQFDPNLKNANKVCTKGECPNGSNAYFTLGPGYFEGFKTFPNAKFTIQAPLGDGTYNETQLLAYVQRAWNAAGADRIDAIALGNEPSVYWKTAKAYYDGAKKVQATLTKALGLKADQRIFEIADTLDGAAKSHKPYAVQELLAAGFDSDKTVKYAAEHWYQGTATTFNIDTLQAELMNHKAIKDRFGAGYMKSINAVLPDNGVSYILSETGSTIKPGAATNYRSGFGATLWSVDFQLAAMTRGIKRVVDSGRPTATHASWSPNNKGEDGRPVVRPPYVANLFVADFIGKDKPRNILSLLPNQEFISSYLMYDRASKRPDRVALLNLKAWDKGSNKDRGSQAFVIPVAAGTDSVRVRRLHSDFGVWATGFDIGGAKENVTWAGEQWTYKIDKGKGHFVGGKLQEQTIKVQDGKATINVPDTEAAIVYL
ncbi:uncharacterized protein F4822DRAFT_429297 [Hypoxylon trugodes]|uniref:uncharacterized protein n=1 Tax=Hypoxylon trugodes TaxID=326681 RepID=UPI002196EACE|nr:uncharacterized protein F4822DRAFT_429297 [Hypoxylon trugodes]KAI1388681.1 hypothetical protein F4822DRAFT_429297 [Hypoxylon trugodes]